MAVWMLSIVSGTVLLLGIATVLQSSKPTEVAQGHFSVRWMGFVPGYSSQYPDYYVTINNLKDATLTMNIALQIKNQEASGFYFTVEKYTEPPAGWNVPTMYVGLVNKDETKTLTYSAYRTKPTSIPSGRITESIDLAVKAYYDAAYTNFYSQDNFPATFHLIDRTSTAWTVLFNDNFDDGTTQGWSSVGPGPSFGVSDTLYRSYRYSLRVQARSSLTSDEAGYTKSFNIPTTYAEAYIVFSIRSSGWPSTYSATRVLLDGVVYFQPDVVPSANIWYQFTIPLPTAPPETTAFTIYATSYGQIAYLDDIYVIAK